MQASNIKNSQSAFNYLRHIIAKDVEEVWVIALNNNKKVLRAGRIFKGTADRCTFHPRDIFKFTIMTNSTAFILAHNHPSEVNLPSKSDIKITKNLKKSAKLLQIDFVDHIIITQFNYFSFQDENIF